ncbi:hypothetical protein [Dethiosulfovibrio salsuginis]|uniref:Uncharacterized protein n=1 Tax=Dethiosulfovibrio salsuginis TaxID=561720 RepID=A0A1X7KXB8_9BACT|nr:hypothetical protein [Dethiosulfovibrio salsuginis]SMG46080.1 hypothetical protein SAMN06275492_13912 [Dethiosulfovibrio salsuginis]
MARKRPSLRNYLIEGDQVRDIQPVIEAPAAELPVQSFAEEMLSSFPTESLDFSLWGLVVASHLMVLKEGRITLSVLKEGFPSIKDDDFNAVLDRALSSQLISLGEDGIIRINPVSRWDIAGSDGVDIEWVDDLVSMMTENDRDMWLSLLSDASLKPLSLDEVKDLFEKSDLQSDQFFMMRRRGDSLLPITRSSQIRLPLESVIMWSEKGDSIVFFGETS